MIRVAWWTCALLALADARIYGRCELALELKALGVRPDHIPTWVCIAYHESRFDTAANNPHSGDHGIFQISELYWCGPGKACGLPCAALRNDDIADDLQCALQVHEEHTRLQGNGFLAWVVYPHHCMHNTKKYVIECDKYEKQLESTGQMRSFNSYRPYTSEYRSTINTTDYTKKDNLPSYLAVSEIFRNSYGKVLSFDTSGRTDWLDYKIDNIDDLKLPVLGKKSDVVFRPTTTTTTTTYVPPVKPWRTIETNQFRKKMLNNDRNIFTTTTIQKYDIFDFAKYTLQSTTPSPPSTLSSPTTAVTTTTTTELPKVKTTAVWYKWPITTSTVKPLNIKTNTTYKSWAFTTSYKPPTTTSTYKPPVTASSYKYSTVSSTAYKWPLFSTTTYKPATLSTTARRAPIVTTTPRPATTTAKYKNSVFFTSSTTAKPTTKYPWYTFTSRLGTTTTPSKLRTEASTLKPVATSTTKKSTTTTSRPTRTTQNIFDLYLNPTKRPQIENRFTFNSGNFSKLQIFAGGTTTIRPQKN